MSSLGLWVDDDRQFLQDNIPLLERHGLRIDRAHGALEALSLLEANPHGYSYLIVDLDMPEMNGVELIRRVRAIHPTIPIMLASAHVDEPVWTARLETLPENLPSIPKVFPMITSPKFDEIVGKIQNLGRGGEPGNLLASGIGQEPVSGLNKHGSPVSAYPYGEQGVPASMTRGNDPVVHFPRKDPEMTSTEITALYSEIRELVSRSSREPELCSEIDRRIELLRRLQEAEADELEFRFEARLRLNSGTGWAFLQRMKERLGDV
jgi:CheY-like chemotaxis protein